MNIMSVETTAALYRITGFPFMTSAAHLFLPHSPHRNLAQLHFPLSFRPITQLNRQVTRSSAVSETDSAVTEEQSVRIVSVVGEGSVSPLKRANWEEVMLHTARRLKWVDEGYEMLVFSDNLCHSNDRREYLKKELIRADILLVVAVSSEESVKWIQANNKHIPNIICFDSSEKLANKLGGSYVGNGTSGTVLDNILKNKETNEFVVLKTILEAWERYNSDDMRFCLLVIINAYIKPVSILKNLRSKGFSTLNCVVMNCGHQILNCLLDPNCMKALQCLENCSPIHQAYSYQCIASYESPKLEAFSLCVLQKNNCLELDAKIPEKPYVPPMVKFRGENLCYETADDLLIGWLGRLDWSWRVVARQNQAYDQFRCQYKLFYREKAQGLLWYEAVFQVRLLEGKLVWRRQKYRVKRGKVPATFYFSALYNGVVLDEFWTIVDVADDLSWGLFHYHGAARATGQSYTGAVLVSPDGAYPDEKERKRMKSALDKCGIKEWEVFMIDNCSCHEAPLEIPEGSKLHSTIFFKEKI